MRPEELAYLAGFFDGEGCVGLYKLSGTYQLKIQVSNLHKGSVERFRDAFGGSVNIHRSQPKTFWQWVVNGEGGVSALRQMLPYLVVKRPQAEEALLTPFSGLIGRHLTPPQRLERIRISLRLKQLKREVA